jgi:TRAP-type C4-dicarboxylate transport system permease large subunit
LGCFREGATVGRVAVVVVLAAMRRLALSKVAEALTSTAAITGLIFTIVIADQVFSPFLALTDVPVRLVEAIGASGLHRYAALTAILLPYLSLGMILDSMQVRKFPTNQELCTIGFSSKERSRLAVAAAAIVKIVI